VTDDDPRATWDVQAAEFDDEPHHSLDDPHMRAAWWDLLETLLPAAPASIADLGCGTGTLAVLLAERGYAVTGLDISPQMIARARAKAVAHDAPVTFIVGDAATALPVPHGLDAVLVRHVLWALPDAGAALDRWITLLGPGGRLVLVEGLWSTGAGITSDDLMRLVIPRTRSAMVVPLTDAALWGAPLTDSRYAVVARP
jgi:SAM-dependent methyltransferase